MLGKKHASKYLISLVFILVVLLATTIKLYLDQLSFLGKIDQVYPVRLSDISKKIVYYEIPDYYGTKILLTDNNVNKLTATEIATLTAAQSLRIQNVNFYNRSYLIIPYGIGEGFIDYFIADENGRVITNSLLQDNDMLVKSNHSSTIQDLREDGSLTLNMNDPKQLAIFDITTGKFKRYENH